MESVAMPAVSAFHAPRSAHWSKLRNGAWGVSVPGPVSAGDVVEVTKKSGETSMVTIGRVLGTRKDGSATLCTVSRDRTAGARLSRDRANAGRCSECGGAIVDAPHHAAMGGLCGQCAFDEYDC